MTIFGHKQHSQAYLKAGFMGFAGAGKSYTASQLAIGLYKLLREKDLAGNAPVFFLDTETGSDWVRPMFDTADIKLEVAKTRAFIDLVPAIKEAANAKGILIADSITHFWRDLTESYAKKKNRKTGLRFDDWNELKRMWGAFTDEYVNSHCHVIMCGRAGYEYEYFKDEETGKKELEKTGIKFKAENETGYEPSLLVLMQRTQDLSGDAPRVIRTGTVMKDRNVVNPLDGRTFTNPTFEHFKPHIDFLNLGGEHLGVDTSRTSEGMIEAPDSSGRYQRERCDIILDEIQSLMVKHHPSTGGADKKAKIELLELAFNTTSWERVKTYDELTLKAGLSELRDHLEGSPDEQPGRSKNENYEMATDDKIPW